VSAEAIIKVENLRKTYNGLIAVAGISFAVKKGEIFGILGPNGAGKTTTLEMIETLRRPDEGKIWIKGIDVQREPQKIKTLIGVQLQSTSFFDYLNLKELLTLFASFYPQALAVEETLALVGLEDKAQAMVRQLSGGQKQRFSLAAALIHDPEIIFLDEPTAGLDPQARRHLWEIIRQLHQRGKTIVLTTHYMDEAELLCQRVAIMDEGQILRLAPPRKLIEDLLAQGFKKSAQQLQANLEDVFLDLTGKYLRD